MDRSTRNLSITTLLMLSIFLALNHVAQRAALGDWWLVGLFLLIALIIWFYERISRRGMDDSEAVETVIEPISFEHHAIPDVVQVPSPAPVAAAKVEAPAPAPVAEAIIEVPAPAPVVEAAAPVAAPVAEVKAEAAAPAAEVKVEAPAAKVKATKSGADDLKVVEGIGPKMEKALHAAGIVTFENLAAASEDQINAAIVAAGMRFAPSVPTWAEQASYAVKGDFAGLEAFQKTLVGGRKAK
jgi:predicted flap endonuclease-1-like 5' DNA nuclease